MGDSGRRYKRRYSNLKLWTFFFLCLLFPWDKECRSFAWDYAVLRVEQGYLYLCKFYLWLMLRLLRFLRSLSDDQRRP